MKTNVLEVKVWKISFQECQNQIFLKYHFVKTEEF